MVPMKLTAKFNMIKGGRGRSLAGENIHSAAKQIVIATESSKFIPAFSWPVPIEIYPFAIHIVRKKFEEIAAGRK